MLLYLEKKNSGYLIKSEFQMKKNKEMFSISVSQIFHEAYYALKMFI